MRGTYRFYQNGNLIGESENLLTTEGKVAIQRYLAGYSGHFGRSIRLGIGATAASASDTALNFETMSAPVYLITPDYVNTALIFKGRLDDPQAGIIYEAGLSSGVNDGSGVMSSRVLVGFESAIDDYSAGTWNTTSVRFGDDNLRLSPATSSTVSAVQDVDLDLSGYSNVDEFKLAYNVSNAFAANAKVIFYTTPTSYYTYTITSPTSGFKIQSMFKPGFVATGTPSWSTITQIGVSATATSGGTVNVDFEALRVDDKDTFNETDILVSRSVLGTQVTKTANMPLDIEYTLDLTL